MRERITALYNGMPHYQAYYWTGLSDVVPFSVDNAPWWYGSGVRPDLAVDIETVTENLRQKLGGEARWNAAEVERFVTEYVWEDGVRTIRFAIDAHDGKELFAPELLKQCDIYFKANKWENEVYPGNVYPIVNGNGFLRKRHLRNLKQLRNHKKSNDLLFISRVWGGVEHNVRLFEALSNINCKKKLVAIFVKGTAGEKQTAEAIRRLESVGVTCTFDLVPIKELWLEIAKSRVVMLRAGKYMCIPWRMIDLLCMGSCIIADASFEPEWPVPLKHGVNYTSADINRPGNTDAAEITEYAKLSAAVTELLGDDSKRREIELNNCVYFDQHAFPESVGNYILSTIRKYVRE